MNNLGFTKYQNTNDQNVKLPILTKLFVWSIVLEPLLFFIIFDRSVSGISPNIGRVLQAIVIVLLVLRLIGNEKRPSITSFKMGNMNGQRHICFILFFAFAVLAALFGVFSGAYAIPVAYEVGEESFFAVVLNSAYVRPFFEYLILLYYYIYFVVLPKSILNDDEKLKYFFSIFSKFFFISLSLGLIDVGFAVIGKELLPRHLADWRMVGVRFHGLAGEPRDAFVYLFFGLAILHLKAIYYGYVLNKKVVLLVLVCAVLTQSASGFIGIVFFMALYLLYVKVSIKRVVQIIVLFTVITATLYVSIVNSERIMFYIKATEGLWDILESKGELPWLMLVQSVNIYPVYDLTVKIRNFDLLPVFIGSGLGSASAIINVYEPRLSGMSNPNSQFIRIIFENGLIGLYLFTLTFIYPIKQLTRAFLSKKHEILIYSLLLLGCFYAHRSSASFIYLGIIFATFNLISMSNFDNQQK